MIGASKRISDHSMCSSLVARENVGRAFTCAAGLAAKRIPNEIAGHDMRAVIEEAVSVRGLAPIHRPEADVPPRAAALISGRSAHYGTKT
jgi:hypothetical protein